MKNLFNDFIPILRTAAGATLCALLLASCNASDSAVAQDTPLASGDSLSSPATAEEETADSATPVINEIVTGPTERDNAEMGLTVGEQLKHLDSLMRVVPPDSLEILMAEYDRLLDSVMTAQNMTDEEQAAALMAAESSPEERTDIVETVIEEPADEEAPEEEPYYVRSTPRSQAQTSTSRTLVQSDSRAEDSRDPAEFKGVRESELTYYQQNTVTTPAKPVETTQQATQGSRVVNITPTPSAQRSSSRTSNGQAARTRTRSRVQSRSASRPSSGTRSSRPASRSLDENYTEGLASFRAGKYTQAISELKPVVNASRSSYNTTARYYYALSLERTGSLKQAASNFRTLMRGSGSLADKSWLGYARVLSRQGKKSQAKKELLRLIQERPSSGQVANARKLLQQM